MTNRPDDIAIISLAGRFPGAKTVEQFWQNLAAGVESIQVFSEAEVLAAGVDLACLRDPSYVRAGAPLDDIDCFDAAFFGYSPREATLMDPQQRVFLECAWEALERAGYAPTQCRDRVGVYAGVSSNDYWQALQTRPDLTASVGHYQTLLGNDKDFLSSRVSYKLNLKGPSLTVQTACSTSLVATVLACQSLLTYQCDMALAGGVSIHTPQTAGYRYQPGGIFSPDGHCRAFDAQAQGTVGGNGVGIVVLKRLEDAIAAGDLIYAVIRGAAINNDGADKVGYTAPSVAGQAAAIAEALALAEVEPETLSYLEAHGTGTALGDPIEIAALTQAFNSSKRQFCALGSVKSNIGHLDAAAGIAGLIKTALALHHRQLPPSLHFEQPNPQIDFANSPFYVNTQRQDWPADSPLRAGVSAMGIGGTNAHLVLEAAPERSPSPPFRPWQVLLLSAKTAPALEQAAHNLAQHLEAQPELALVDVAYTLHTGRVAFGQRRMLVCQSRDEAIAALRATEPIAQAQEQPAVAFLFPGQGAQYVQMAQELYQSEPDFRQTIDYCAALLKSQLGWDLRSLLYPDPDQLETAQAQLQETAIAQPVLFVVEYALAQLWMAWGIQPQALLGHSLGEYVAACLAGVFSLADALHLVARRGQLMQQMPAGQMLSVALSAEQVQPYLGDDCWLAVHNAPQLCVVSGTAGAIATLQTRLEQENISCRRLKTSHAFHSPLMADALAPFRQAVSQVALHPPQMPLISNVTGTWLTPDEATSPDYWASHLRQPVQFSQGVSELLHQSPTVLLEVGPGRTLATLARQHPLGDTQVFTSLRHPQEQVSDAAFLLSTLGQLWLNGVAIDGAAFYRHEQRQRVLLPTYPFERQRYWIEPAPIDSVQPQPAQQGRSPIEDWFYLPTWTRSPIPFAPTAERSRRTWLLFIDERGIGEQLARRLRATDHAVVVVRAGEQFQQQENGYCLNPNQPEDYRALVRSLRQTGQFPDAIVHGWSLSLTTTAFHGNRFDADLFAATQDLGFYSVLHLAQALQQADLAEPLTLWLLTNQVHAVTGVELLRPEQATLVGTHAVIAQECPAIACRTVDVDVPELLTADLLGRLVACLGAELLHGVGDRPTDRIVAYRSQHRWTQTFEPLPIPAPELLPKPLRTQGVYLITGGLAGIGNALAEDLAQTAQARLAFLEAEPLPPRSDWPRWLAAQPDSDPICRKIRQLQRLERLGAEVLVCTAEVSDLAQVQGAIAQIEARWGALHGIMHTAETTAEASFRPIQQTGRKESEWQFAPKVKGLQVLAEALAPKCLDFCLIQSSIASQLGGFIAHAAANWFMDALVPALNQSQPTPWISVNWEGWRFWHQADAAEGAATATLSREEGIETFKRVLTLRNIPQVVVSTTELAPRMQKLHRVERSPARTAADAPRTDRPRNAIEQTVAAIWQDLLGIDEISIHATFFDLGGHSLLAVQVMSRIREAFQVELPLRILLIEQPTIAGLAGAIAAQISPTDEPSDALESIQDILADLEALSPEDLDALLAKS